MVFMVASCTDSVQRVTNEHNNEPASAMSAALAGDVILASSQLSAREGHQQLAEDMSRVYPVAEAGIKTRDLMGTTIAMAEPAVEVDLKINNALPKSGANDHDGPGR